MRLHWRFTGFILLCLVYLISGVKAYCNEGDSNYTKIVSYQELKNKTKQLRTTTMFTPDCDGFFGWFKQTFTSRCEERSITKYRLVSYFENITNTEENITCCPGFYKNGEDVCTTGCPRGVYGENCTVNCTCPENAFHNCDKDTGDCTCKSGWTGPNCDQTCEVGYYGLDCKGRCTCKNNGTCDKYTGFCNCTAPGWYGDSCEIECAADKYGIYCGETCQCNTHQTCDPATGNCRCKPGRNGTECQDECSEGFYGQDCLEKCSCNEDTTEFCNKTNGQCMCKVGYDGRNCNLDCPFGTFGSRCQQLCTDKCNHTNYCSPIFGDCLCIGTKGDNCSEECDNGTFGINCGEKCNCKLSDTCHPIFGNCSCPPGLRGPDCQAKDMIDEDGKATPLDGSKNEKTVKKIDEKSDMPVILSIIAVGVALVVAAIAVVLVIVMKRRRRQNNSKEESATEKEPSDDSETDVVENASYIPLEMVENQESGQSSQHNKQRNKNRGPSENSELNSNILSKIDKTTEAGGTHGVSRPDPLTRSECDYTEANVYDRTNVEVKHEAVNTYNTFDDVKRINESNLHVNSTDEEYNVLHEVKKPAKPIQDNYDTFANVKLSQTTTEQGLDDTYNTLNENQTHQIDVTETYAKAKTKIDMNYQREDRNSLKDVYENHTDVQYEPSKALSREIINYVEDEVYENSNSGADNFGSYENTPFHQDHNEFKDEANIYEC